MSERSEFETNTNEPLTTVSVSKDDRGYDVAVPILPDFMNAIRALPGEPSFQQVAERFTLYNEDRLRIIYAPFDFVNRSAKVVFAGITPGWHQAQAAFKSVKTGLIQGDTIDKAIANAKNTASFAGPMRANLCTMLDSLGLPKWLNIATTSLLFSEAHDLLHSTSVIRYPVFVDGQNYTGHEPGILKHPYLLKYVDTFGDELDAMPNALIVPLGKAVEKAIQWLISHNRLEKRRCLLGFPHPSGGNGHRIRQFRERRVELTTMLDEWFMHTM